MSVCQSSSLIPRQSPRSANPVRQLLAVVPLSWLGLAGMWLLSAQSVPVVAQETKSWNFAPEQLSSQLGIGYAVKLIDMNADERLDIAVVDKARVFWLENPQWREHVILEGETKPDNVCFDMADIDQDGKLDVALGADWTLNTRQGGTIQWLRQGDTPTSPWTLTPIGEEPTVHRLRFCDLNNDARPELVVLPLMGRNSTGPHFAESGVRVLSFAIPTQPQETSAWKAEVLSDNLHVTHNFWPGDLDQDGKTDLLVVSFEGVTWLRPATNGSWTAVRIGEGNQQTSPNRGASEIKLGRLNSGQPYVATIEPWHGHQVVVYRPTNQGLDQLWERTVLDEQLKWGHAVWCANLDSDPEEELVIGVRDDFNAEFPCGVRIYDPQLQADGSVTWHRSLIDPAGVNVEDLAVGDLNGDQRADVVAVGRQSRNIRIYWNREK